jgi:cell wall assembly regulator SMI1
MVDIQLLEQLLAGATLAGPATQEAIRHAEATLGVEFPGTYKAFLARSGAALYPGFEIAGVFSQAKNGDPPLWTDVVTSTIQMRRSSRGLIPKEYVPISNDGGDYVFYLDTARLGPEKECPVVVLGPGADARVVASNFVDFLARSIHQSISF